MVGPFVQGLLLIGIIYWYSKGMMSMINDYYRSEFQRQLQTEKGAKKAVADETPINVDNFMDYVRELNTPNNKENGKQKKIVQKLIWNQDYSPMLLHFLRITGSVPQIDVCWSNSSSIS